VRLVQNGESAGEFKGELNTFGRGKPPAPAEEFSECEGDVAVGIDGRAGIGIVRRLHHVVEVAGVVVATDVQERELARPARDRGLESADAFQLASEGAIVLEAV